MAVHSTDLRDLRDLGRYPTQRAFRSRQQARLRRRLVSIAMAVGVMLGTLMIGGSAPASRAGTPPAIVVESGQTLWEIAERYAPEGGDVRAYIDAVVELNDLGGILHSGQRIKLPR